MTSHLASLSKLLTPVAPLSLPLGLHWGKTGTGDSQVEESWASRGGKTERREPDTSQRLWKSKKQSQVAPCDLLVREIKVAPLVPGAPRGLYFATKRMRHSATDKKVTLLITNYSATRDQMRLAGRESPGNATSVHMCRPATPNTDECNFIFIPFFPSLERRVARNARRILPEK